MDFNANSFEIFNQEWALLTAGTPQRYNTMTISWGGLGTLWGKPAVTVYVKPIRYTHEFMEESEYFTVSFYPGKYRKALGLLGSLSGRDGDKVAQAGLAPRLLDNAVTFREAKVTLVCKKIYRQDMDTEQMPVDVVSDYYEGEAAHTIPVWYESQGCRVGCESSPCGICGQPVRRQRNGERSREQSNGCYIKMLYL